MLTMAAQCAAHKSECNSQCVLCYLLFVLTMAAQCAAHMSECNNQCVLCYCCSSSMQCFPTIKYCTVALCLLIVAAQFVTSAPSYSDYESE